MNPNSYIFILVFTLCLSFITGCNGRNETLEVTEEVEADSLQADSSVTEPIEEEVEVIPTKTADELFDDFVFAFMKNHDFQRQRTQFPLRITRNGKKSTIARTDWHHDPMYSQYDAYTLIFDDVKGEKAAKDTTLKKVVVEELDLEARHTKSYYFNRQNGEWHLSSLSEQPFGDSPNSDFYHFYHRFATDPQYQRSHISDPLTFSTFDDDSFETIEGTLSPEQFSDFSPELPTTKITNILYGQSFTNSNLRVLSLRALSGGMECTMVFKRSDGEWKLTRLEN